MIVNGKDFVFIEMKGDRVVVGLIVYLVGALLIMEVWFGIQALLFCLRICGDFDFKNH